MAGSDEDLRDTRNDLVICREVLAKTQHERDAARARANELLQEQERRWDCRAPEYGPPCGACTSCMIREREALESEVQRLRRSADCGKMGDEACGDCDKCWRLAALRTNVELIDARHILSRLVTTIRWICESRPDVAAALEINLAWIRAIELLGAHCPEKEAPCSPET